MWLFKKPSTTEEDVKVFPLGTEKSCVLMRLDTFLNGCWWEKLTLQDAVVDTSHYEIIWEACTIKLQARSLLHLTKQRLGGNMVTLCQRLNDKEVKKAA